MSTVILYYAKWCPWSKKFRNLPNIKDSEWTKTKVLLLENNIYFKEYEAAEIDLKLNINAYPTIHIHHGDKVIEYPSTERYSENILKYVKETQSIYSEEILNYIKETQLMYTYNITSLILTIMTVYIMSK